MPPSDSLLFHVPPSSFTEPDDAMRNPITYGEMRLLLEPLQACLQRMERIVQERSGTLPPAHSFFGNETSTQDGSLEPTSPVPSSIRAASTAEAESKSAPEQQRLPPAPRGTETKLSIRSEDAPICSDEAAEEPANLNRSATNGIVDVNHDIGPSMLLHLNISKVLGSKGMAKKLDSRTNYLASKMEAIHTWWHRLEEPERADSYIYRFSTSRSFHTTCILVIIFNSALVAYTADWRIQHIGVHEPSIFDILEKCCLVWFIFELLVRLLGHRQHFFINYDMRWNIFDLILVTISIVNLAFEAASTISGSDVTFMRILRLLKLAKIFRSMRSFRFVKSLQVLLDCFGRSFLSLFWGLVMLAFIIYLFSLIFMQAVIDHFTDDADSNMKSVAMEKFGSLITTSLSLYMAVTGGDDWINLYNIVAQTGWIYGLVFVFYTFSFTFGIFNILTALLVEKAMAASKPERAQLVLEQRKRIAEDRDTFMQVCRAMDKNGDGVISWDEFQEWMCHPVMLSYMASIGIEIHDVELFFTYVGARQGRDGKIVSCGEISIDHLVEGLMHMKGEATALDMQRQLFELHVLHHDVKDLQVTFEKRVNDLEELIHSSLDQHSVDQVNTPAPSLHETSQAQFLPSSL